ncbi:hypothetical protein LWC34_45170 [Kibdelosporangium philippinense]|uniref:Uncharacterized protein n=1 Tax=Kibdelosporangium philippinense TaxID=211113 RepID=A0ABS8ZQD9_9PSEU|nr:hypothetical protein [Kibdelosporangium philippinense]MCE7009951.1 hypothetical protein [Kibdelosporangium philippinense]
MARSGWSQRDHAAILIRSHYPPGRGAYPAARQDALPPQVATLRHE